MKKGDVPVPYIVALILAAIIIGVLGYWFFVVMGKGGGVANEQICNAKMLQVCIGKEGSYTPAPEIKECDGLGKTQSCSEILGGGASSSQGTTKTVVEPKK